MGALPAAKPSELRPSGPAIDTTRLRHLVRKEIVQLLRNPLTLRMVIVVPLLQTILFGYVTTTDVKRISLLVCDLDGTAYSRQLVAQLTNSGYFNLAGATGDPREIDRWLVQGWARVALVLPPRMASEVTAGRTAVVQAIFDGSNSSEASIAKSYLQRCLAAESVRLVRLQAERLGVIGIGQPLENRPRVWFNPDLRSVNYMIPGVMCLVLFMITSLLTALGIVREKEQGTMEQLAVSPLTPAEIIAGKTLPFAAVAFVEAFLVLLVGTLWFGVAVKGSLLWLAAASMVFVLTVLAIGMFVSTLAHTQAQAMMVNQLFMATNMMLSGFMFPISSMPAAMQLFTYLVPLRYFLEIIRGIYLKGTGPSAWWPQLLILFAFGLALFSLSALRFRKRLD